MEVASKHPEAEGEASRPHVKKRLLLDGITLEGIDVTMRCMQLPIAVKSHFADPGEACRDGTPMSASEAAQAATIESLKERRFLTQFGELIGQRFHLGTKRN